MNYTIHPQDFQSLLQCLIPSKGKLVGGIVRNFVQDLLECNDIDIWFTSNDDKDMFIREFTSKHTFMMDETRHINEQGFDKYLGYWKLDEYCIPIELMVCLEFPMGDFSFNLLSYDGNIVQSESTQFTTEEIISHIIHKSGFILKSNPRNMHKYIQYGYTLNKL